MQLQCAHDLVRAASADVLTQETIKDWHRTLFQAFVPLAYYAGSFRQHDLTRPCLQILVEVGAIVGTLPDRVPDEMNLLFSELNANVMKLEDRWGMAKPAERAGLLSKLLAWFVGSFIRIHPFINGNGHTSRLLWRWGLHRYGVPPQIRSHPRPDPPYGAVMRDAMRGDDKALRKHILQHLRRCNLDMAP